MDFSGIFASNIPPYIKTSDIVYKPFKRQS